MPGAIHNYWLGIMALAFALAVVLWIGLVFNASRHPGGKAQESWPHRDVMGGHFSAREGGRQVTPDPRVPPEPEEEVEAEAMARQQPTARPPAPRESPETGVPTAHEAGSKTAQT
jgi:hypothetical protein